MCLVWVPQDVPGVDSWSWFLGMCLGWVPQDVPGVFLGCSWGGFLACALGAAAEEAPQERGREGQFSSQSLCRAVCGTCELNPELKLHLCSHLLQPC